MSTHGADEIAPAYDHAETTVNAATAWAGDTGALAHKKRHRAGGPVTRPCAAPEAASLRYPGRAGHLVATERVPHHLHRGGPARRPRRPPDRSANVPGVVECQLHGSSP